MIDEKVVIKKLEQRKDEFLKNYPDRKSSVEIETISEFIHMLELEAKYQNLRTEQNGK